MKIDLKGILKSMPIGNQNQMFYKLNEAAHGIKENIPGTDSKIWILAYNLSYFWENQPVRRYLSYDENPKNYKLDQGLLPYVKVIRAYARMPDHQKETFRNEIQQPVLSHNKAIQSTQHLNSKQMG